MTIHFAPRTASMLGELVPCGGGAPIPLAKATLIVGRQDYCDVVLPHGAVSSRHCLLEWTDGHWSVRDLGSRNGTLVNGVACQAQRLLPGDVLSVANVRFFVDYRLAPETAPPDETPRVEDNVRRAGIAFGDVPPPEAVGRKSSKTGIPLGELVPCGGGDPIPLLKPLLLIGRDTNADIVLPCGTVSGRHCELEFTNGFWWVRDVGSRNGTRVDGVECQSACIKPGQVVSISKHRYRIEYEAPATGSKPSSPSASFIRSMLEKAGLARPAESPEPQGDKKPPPPPPPAPRPGTATRRDEGPASPRRSVDDREGPGRSSRRTK